MLASAIYLGTMGRTEIQWLWNERNQVFEGEGAELALTTSPPPPNLAHTQQNDLSLKRGLLPEKDLFSLKKDYKKYYG